MKINELIDSIRKKDLVLPEFQREYVWTKEQSKQLMVSIIKGFPIGSLLFWKTDEPPALKNVDKLPEKFGTVQVVLDGQQRLTTLFMLITGEIPLFYKEREIQNDPRDLYFNLENKEFRYYQPTRMSDNPLWCKVVDLFIAPSKYDIFKIAQKESDDEQNAFDLASQYNDNLNNLKNITNVDLPVQNVPSKATLTDSIDIFDRVNSQGTKLSDAELALTHVTGKWPEARRKMKDKIRKLSELDFNFDLTFMTRALVGVVTKRALFNTIHDKQKKDLIEGWNNLSKILDYIVNILPSEAFIDSTKDLNTTNVLIPLIVYLSVNDGKFFNNKEIKKACHWLYSAHTWTRYTAQTDQRLEHDLSIIVRKEHPWESLCTQIIDQRGRIKVKPDDLEGRGVQHPLFRMTLILAKAHGAKDWFNGLSLRKIYGKSYDIQRHHIFPQSILYDDEYDPDNHLHRKIVNEIANRAFLTADSNIKLSNNLPKYYLPEVEENYPGALKKQFIPMKPQLWEVDSYPDFLQTRREIIAKKINEFMSALISEPEDISIQREKPVEDLIKIGESATLEFKSTLQWDMVQNKMNKNLRHSVLKTIAAFLNSDGGTLVIGVEDDGNICGLKNDLKVLHNSIDHFEQTLTSLIIDYIGAIYSGYVKIRFEEVEGKKICVVDIEKAQEPAFLKGKRGKEFHIRFGNTTRILDAEETTKYVQENWR